jgi:hypothetical protein
MTTAEIGCTRPELPVPSPLPLSQRASGRGDDPHPADFAGHVPPEGEGDGNALPQAIFTYSKSPGWLLTPARGEAIQLAYLPGS